MVVANSRENGMVYININGLKKRHTVLICTDELPESITELPEQWSNIYLVPGWENGWYKREICWYLYCHGLNIGE